ncbi:MAG: shikimate kinase [Alphaproteobacteria bacterium]
MSHERLNVDLDRSIVLVGLMGAGKSAVGRRLAARLGLKFIDADQEIEKAAGCSIEDIFEFHGEPAFREGERRVVARLLNEPPHVLATGGGAFMDPSTRQRIRERGVSVWLRADIELLLSRVSRRNDRPLLKDGDKRETLTRLIAERHPVYAMADIVVDSEDVPHDRMVDKIIAALNAYFGEHATGAPRQGMGVAPPIDP